jgi:hypothetical protein
LLSRASLTTVAPVKRLLLALAACSGNGAPASPDGPADVAPDAGFPAPIALGDFPHPLDKPFIRGLQTWIDDPTFEVKWTAALATPIDFLGSADSAFHADLASRTAALPGGDVLCHGDAKLDNFGWAFEDGTALFSDADFDDAGHCPAAADILHLVVATDLLFADPALDMQAIDAYVDTLRSAANAIAIDATTEPVWDTLRSKGVDKATHGDVLAIENNIVAATPDERTALAALVAGDARFPTTLVDVAREVRTDGGSAGLRRYWLLVEDAVHPRTIIELKELSPPGTEIGWHGTPLDGADRFDILKPFWWATPAPNDHFEVSVLAGTFVARDRFARDTLDPTALTTAQHANAIQAEASLLAIKHATAWLGDLSLLESWLATSAQALTARWRQAYAVAGGT